MDTVKRIMTVLVLGVALVGAPVALASADEAAPRPATVAAAQQDDGDGDSSGNWGLLGLLGLLGLAGLGGRKKHVATTTTDRGTMGR